VNVKTCPGSCVSVATAWPGGTFAMPGSKAMDSWGTCMPEVAVADVAVRQLKFEVSIDDFAAKSRPFL